MTTTPDTAAFGLDAAFVREHEAEIRREAESDAPDAWVFQELLESVEGIES